ncbi:hypothetical protein LZ32DRAFT_628132 [Colletotrichum eremochloae]|nr:hypothetical protein LZ32DRAFT_628132 [Colletotrichum eremochloae]
MCHLQLISATPPNVDDSAAAGRAMHFYHAVAAPALTGDPALVLFVCVLFICIELLQNSPQNAIAHCRHGINILNEVQTESDFLRQHVVPAMHQLNQQASPIRWPTPRKRRRGPHATDTSTDPSSALFSHWRGEAFGRRATHRPDGKEHAALCLLEIQYIIIRNQLLLSDSKSENDYDAYLDDYRAVVGLTAMATASSCHSGDGSTRSTPLYTGNSAIELGFSPLLYFVVSKCRYLSVRIAALKMMKQLARPRDNVWVKPVTAAVARRIVEVEHQISLDDLEVRDWVDDGELPPEKRRVISVDFYVAGDMKCGGSLRQVNFLSRDPNSGMIIARHEWINI